MSASPQNLLDAAERTGMSRPVELAFAFSRIERTRRGRGELPRPFPHHAARAVLQGLIGYEDALLSLAVIYGQMFDREPTEWRRTATAAERATSDLSFAVHLLDQAIARENMQRALLAARMRKALAPMLAQWATPEDLMAELRRINDDAGRPFVWPELRQLLNAEAERFVRDQRFTQRGRRHG
jgi:hypothetical protein